VFDDPPIRRPWLLAQLVLEDTARLARRHQAPAPDAAPVWHEGIEAGIAWLCLAHDATGRRGCSRGFDLLRGWRAAFAETTGYIIGTLIDYGLRTGSTEHVERARQMGDWEMDVQNGDGGVVEGLVDGRPKPSNVFNTGMVIHGWLDLVEHERNDDYLAAADCAGRWLIDNQDDDGAWRGAVEYYGIPHTYNTRVAWALLRLAAATGDVAFRRAGTKTLEWALTQQRDDGWFDSCTFKPRMLPSTHGLAYTIRGLTEGGTLLEREDMLEAAMRTSRALIGKLEAEGRLPGAYRSGWRGTFHECLTGTAQLGGVWMRLFELRGERRYRDAGLRAVELAASHQVRADWPPVRGALAGSFPIYGRYAPLQFPNWATKFLVDVLVQRGALLERESEGRRSRDDPGRQDCFSVR
jgi:Squalene-hopene cyclase C-terminal domain